MQESQRNSLSAALDYSFVHEYMFRYIVLADMMSAPGSKIDPKKLMPIDNN